MEWRHGTWQCGRCRFKLGCCEGEPQTQCEAPRRRIGALARTATLILVLLVMAGSAAAFAISEGLKVQKAAITAVQIPTRTFSPVCDCPSDRVTIGFHLTRSDRMTVGIVDSHGQIVRTLVGNKLFGRGKHHFTWNGPTESGRWCRTASTSRASTCTGPARHSCSPYPITVDTTPPRIVADRRASATRSRRTGTATPTSSTCATGSTSAPMRSSS